MLHGEALLHAALQCCGNFWGDTEILSRFLTAFGNCQIWRPPTKKNIKSIALFCFNLGLLKKNGAASSRKEVGFKRESQARYTVIETQKDHRRS
jgi:hypothetical protein